MNEEKFTQCEATTSPIFWWIYGKSEFPQCKRNASIIIDDIKLCRTHAGIIALQKLVSTGQAEQIRNSYSPVCSMDRYSKNIRSIK